MAPGTFYSAITANRHVHFRFCGATSSNSTLSGTQRSGGSRQPHASPRGTVHPQDRLTAA
jgi:hypothetical protein